MKKWGIIFAVLFVVGCREQPTDTDTESEVQWQATIPAGVVEQYGLLQLEQQLDHVETVRHANGAVTFMLNPQEKAWLKENVNRFFSQYEQAVLDAVNDQIKNISYDNLYQNIHFYVENEAVIYDENFLLAEELLIKKALAYQLIHGERLKVAVLYYDASGTHVLSKKTVPIQLSTVD